ncbi:AAA family ATPase [Sinorhizobium sp. 7-81]|uniref:AAA family ATPase n=1 Tax=Sinorhizobium sp. 8-89 TaxID=3049089 RepID=UPI0024C2DABC|nr:AAA family ATPase [Sinorhizobium sp. 8-89]MDK1494174.1 AAA family ATPase [Sinorhizobium sp. 8-89]
MDVGAWLRELGLERYEEPFRENEIDARSLPHLTAEDLKELGVTLVGHRRLLLEAIAALGKAHPASATQEPQVQGPARSPQGGAERRQLTVLFCDLVGSTALAARLDPEDMGAIVRAYHRCSTDVIRSWGGHVAKYMGDGVLAYFGFPQAHEDDAERAIHAGLALIDAVAGLRTASNEPVGARVGISTGLVVVGELIGEGAAHEESVVGDTPNLAARLQALAQPNTVVIGPTTHQLARGFFEYADLGSHKLKGFSAPIQAWQVIGTTRAETRFEAAHEAGVTPFVGREQEIALLMDRWSQASEGEGQVVLISADPGMGKSRITQILREHLTSEAHTRLRYQCSPHHRNSTLYPIIDQLERAAGIGPQDTADSKLDKLETVLAQSATNLVEVVPLFAALLSVPTGTRYPAVDLSTPRQKESLFEALAQQVDGLAAHRPVLFIFEDAHWIDPTSHELLDQIIDRAQRLRILVVVTFRPEFVPTWTRYPHVTFHSLNRLTRKQVETMVENVAGGKILPTEVLDQIALKTDGVPLFVEELTKTILESDLLVARNGSFVLRGSLPPFAIPSTLQDSLMARLDRLAPVKEVAQIGAVIGREFSHQLLAAVSSLPEPELESSLDQLLQSELVFRRGVPPQTTYVFKHALVQDAAYATLLRSRKQQLHARVAQILREYFPAQAEAEPEVLAGHYMKAGLTDEAITHWLLAGRRATERSANVEAISHLTAGLQLLAAQPDSPERAKRELMLQIGLAVPLTAAKGYAAPETARAYTRARELCGALGDTKQLFPAMYGEWVYHMVKAHQQEARRVAEEFLRLAERHGARGGIVVAHRTLGLTLLNLGQLAAAREQMEQVVALYDPEAHRSLAFRYGQDPRSVGLSFLAWIEWLQGYPDVALKHSREAIDLAHDLGHATTTAYALSVAPYVYHFRGDLAGAHKAAEAAVAFCKEERNPFWLATARVIWGWALAEGGYQERGLAEIRSGLDGWRETDSAWLSPCYLALFAQALVKANQPDQALEALDQGLAIVGETSERLYESELHRLKGELLLQLSPQQAKDSAEVEYLKALEIARKQAAVSLELRAGTSIARLWCDQGKRAEARDLLAPVYRRFTEGFHTADLGRAKAVLDALL